VQAVQDGAGVQLVVERPEDRDPRPLLPGHLTEQVPGNQLAGRVVLIGRMAGAPALELVAKGSLAPEDLSSALAVHADRIQK
jgi:hypothetical protein